MREHLLTRYDGWHEDLLHMLRRSNSGFTHRLLFAPSVPHIWEHVPVSPCWATPHT